MYSLGINMLRLKNTKAVHISLDKLVFKSFDTIDIDTWLLVIPQLLARVNIKDERIKNTLSKLLTKIGLTHPRALIYPYIIMIIILD